MDSSSNLEHYRFEVLVKKLNSRFSQLQLLPILENLLRLITDLLQAYYGLTTVLLQTLVQVYHKHAKSILQVHYRLTAESKCVTTDSSNKST